MNMPFFATALTSVFFGLPPDSSDLARIERRIAKEPTYETTTPEYLLLVFGPEAKTRVWLVFDGDVLYADLNGNGDLTENGERFTTKGDAAVDLGEVRASGKTKYTGLKVIRAKYEELWYFWVTVTVESKFTQSTLTDRRNLPRFADSVRDAPIVHFDGPLTMQFTEYPEYVYPGDKARHCMAAIGTPGAGKGVFAAISIDAVPKDAHPVAVAEFPANNGNEPVKEKFLLNRRC